MEEQRTVVLVVGEWERHTVVVLYIPSLFIVYIAVVVIKMEVF